MIKPCIEPIIRGPLEANIDTGMLFVTQNIPKANTIPKAESHKLYHNASGNPKLFGGSKNERPIKFSLVEFN